MRRTLIAAALLLPAFAAGCDNGPTQSNDTPGQVAIRFSTAAGVSASRAPGMSLSTASAGGLSVQGSNGTLAISDVRLIVSRFELRRVAGSCPDSTTAGGTHADRGGDDGAGHDRHDDSRCRRFRAAPSVLALPLDGSPVTVATDSVPAGTYGSVKFKVENLADERGEHEQEHGGGDDAAEQSGLAAVLAQVRATYPNFPETASMVVQGTFTPTGGAAQPFTVYFRAHIDVEKKLEPPLTIPGSTSVTIAVDPSAWFKNGAQVVNLAAANGKLLAFEVEMEHGFAHAEHEHGGSGHN
jgi:hypothetical protein